MLAERSSSISPNRRKGLKHEGVYTCSDDVRRRVAGGKGRDPDEH